LFQADEGQGRVCVRVVPSYVCQLDNRFSREFCVWIERPAQFVQYRIGVVLVRESEARSFFVGGLKFGKFRCCAFNGHVVGCQTAFKPTRKTRAYSIKFIVTTKFELGIDFRSEPCFPQSLKRVITRLILLVNTLLVPSSCGVSEII